MSPALSKPERKDLQTGGFQQSSSTPTMRMELSEKPSTTTDNLQARVGNAAVARDLLGGDQSKTENVGPSQAGQGNAVASRGHWDNDRKREQQPKGDEYIVADAAEKENQAKDMPREVANSKQRAESNSVALPTAESESNATSIIPASAGAKSSASNDPNIWINQQTSDHTSLDKPPSRSQKPPTVEGEGTSAIEISQSNQQTSAPELYPSATLSSSGDATAAVTGASVGGTETVQLARHALTESNGEQENDLDQITNAAPDLRPLVTSLQVVIEEKKRMILDAASSTKAMIQAQATSRRDEVALAVDELIQRTYSSVAQLRSEISSIVSEQRAVVVQSLSQEKELARQAIGVQTQRLASESERLSDEVIDAGRSRTTASQALGLEQSNRAQTEVRKQANEARLRGERKATSIQDKNPSVRKRSGMRCVRLLKAKLLRLRRQNRRSRSLRKNEPATSLSASATKQTRFRQKSFVPFPETKPLCWI